MRRPPSPPIRTLDRVVFVPKGGGPFGDGVLVQAKLVQIFVNGAVVEEIPGGRHGLAAVTADLELETGEVRLAVPQSRYVNEDEVWTRPVLTSMTMRSRSA